MTKQEQQEWIRARQPEQIEERRRAILATARDMLAESDFRDLSLNELARQAGFTKSNLYRYFGSMEEIFLEIYAEEVGQWLSAASTGVQALGNRPDAGRIADALATALAGRSLLLKLMPMLTGVLERNAGEEAILRMKLQWTADMQVLLAALASARPDLGNGQLTVLMQGYYGLCMGFSGTCNTGEVVDRVLEHPELQYMKVDIHTLLSGTLAALIRGLEQQ
ncbi:TetR family transcriptional regulator [bacterium]|nr:TetR family transcriptional regulator [bacterium]